MENKQQLIDKQKTELLLSKKPQASIEQQQIQDLSSKVDELTSLIRMMAQNNLDSTREIATTIDTIDHKIDTVDNAAVEILDVTTTGFKSEMKMLEKIRKDISNIPGRYGCSAKSISGLLKCILSLIETVISIIKFLSFLYYTLLNQVKNSYRAILPFKFLVLMLDCLIAWYHAYLMVLLITAIGLYTGNDNLAEQAFRTSLNYSFKCIHIMTKALPSDAMQQTLNTVPRIVHEELIQSPLKPHYEQMEGFIVTSADTILYTLNSLQNMVEYQQDVVETVNNGMDYFTELQEQAATGIAEGAAVVLNNAKDTVVNQAVALTESDTATAIADHLGDAFEDAADTLGQLFDLGSKYMFTGGKKRKTMRKGGGKSKKRKTPKSTTPKRKTPKRKNAISLIPSTKSTKSVKLFNTIANRTKMIMKDLSTKSKRKVVSQSNAQLLQKHIQLANLMMNYTLVVAKDAIRLSASLSVQ